MNEYEARQAARKARYEERAERLSEDASRGSRRLHGEAGFKYYGVQPMDVGTGAGAKDIGLGDNIDILRQLQ